MRGGGRERERERERGREGRRKGERERGREREGERERAERRGASYTTSRHLTFHEQMCIQTITAAIYMYNTST